MVRAALVLEEEEKRGNEAVQLTAINTAAHLVAELVGKVTLFSSDRPSAVVAGVGAAPSSASATASSSVAAPSPSA